MPLESYANSLASQLTGRETWSASRGPEAYAGRRPIELLCDLLFNAPALLHKPLIGIENVPLKTKAGLDPAKRFFAPTEISSCAGLAKLLEEFEAARAKDQNAQPTREQKMALELRAAIERIAFFAAAQPLAIVPGAAGEVFLTVGLNSASPGAEKVRDALTAFGKAYTGGRPLDEPAAALVSAIHDAGQLAPKAARALKAELFYNSHRPWIMTAYAYGLAMVFFGLSRLFWKRALVALAIVASIWGIVEHVGGLALRTVILDRVPVSNTYESLLWLGLVAIGFALLAQIVNRRGGYIVGGLAVAELSVLFSNLVPLESQTNALPAVLRSNFWLVVHVLTIVASYGLLALASLLGHVYLVKEVLLKRSSDADAGSSHPLIVQTYRSIQLGLVLLTAGTILGGVWAADSWGRFWGWDPKETWALISILVYFTFLHARYVRWLGDFGLAASAVLGFASIVWTFYGVNYLMAAGLHNYGSGTGGGTWVAAWAGAELLFVVGCKLKARTNQRRAYPPRGVVQGSQAWLGNPRTPVEVGARSSRPGQPPATPAT